MLRTFLAHGPHESSQWAGFSHSLLTLGLNNLAGASSEMEAQLLLLASMCFLSFPASLCLLPWNQSSNKQLALKSLSGSGSVLRPLPDW